MKSHLRAAWCLAWIFLCAARALAFSKTYGVIRRAQQRELLRQQRQSHLLHLAESSSIITAIGTDPSSIWDSATLAHFVPPQAQHLWDDYNAALDADPLLTKCKTSLVGFIIGDILAQLGVERTDEYDPLRTLRLASFGVFIHGTSGHYFYGFLDSILPGTEASTVATKVLTDQILWAPVFTAIFFGYLYLLEGKSAQEYQIKLQNDLFSTVRGSWVFWGPAHVLNFLVIPPPQRLLYINVLQIIYNIFLSIVGNNDDPSQSSKGEEDKMSLAT